MIRQGRARRTPEGGVRAIRDLLPTPERQEVERIGQKLVAERGLAFRTIEDGQTIRGRLVGSAQLASGRFAMIDDGVSCRGGRSSKRRSAERLSVSCAVPTSPGNPAESKRLSQLYRGRSLLTERTIQGPINPSGSGECRRTARLKHRTATARQMRRRLFVANAVFSRPSSSFEADLCRRKA
ncbi:MAG: DUF3363 domain-containing protein [Bradyrhizobium sp.]|nr:DUF3363 domain-containing protein [Bradyrhizobium sp.]